VGYLVKEMNRKRIWTKSYGDLLLKRAQGKIPEMESSKSAAEKIKKIVKKNDKILDVGCGMGNYYISMKKRINFNFEYVGIDVIDDYIRKAKLVFKNEKNVFFKKGDVFQIPFNKNSFDVVMCNNFLHNLPSIEKPLRELLRVTKRYLLIRTLVGTRSFRIQEVRNSSWSDSALIPAEKEFKSNGEPVEFNFFNIYSQSYLDGLIKKLSPNSKYRFSADTSFDPKAIIKSAKKDGKLANYTSIIGDYQVNGYILMPWTFIEIIK